MTGVAELFQELADASRNHYELQLEMWCLWRAERDADRVKTWRRNNREHIRRYDATRRPLKPKRVKTPDMCRDCYEQRVPGRASCVGHLEKARQRAARSVS